MVLVLIGLVGHVDRAMPGASLNSGDSVVLTFEMNPTEF